MWTSLGDAYPQPKNDGYGGNKGPAKKRKKPNTWCWTHGISYHTSVTCKRLPTVAKRPLRSPIYLVVNCVESYRKDDDLKENNAESTNYRKSKYV